jgi:hypothetical protein
MYKEIESLKNRYPATNYPMVDLEDPNRIVSISMKASDVWKLRKIVACLSNPSSSTYEIILSVADNATHADMDHLHRVLYFAENGWDFMTKEEAARILGEK